MTTRGALRPLTALLILRHTVRRILRTGLLLHLADVGVDQAVRSADRLRWSRRRWT